MQLQSRIRMTVLCIAMLPALSQAATYYIDFVGGSNANAGTTKAAPWKFHPYMAGFSHAYTHVPGDQFIFKGGVTWPYASFVGFLIPVGGTSNSVRDYYGVDGTWFSGGSFTKPIFDFGSGAFNWDTGMELQGKFITVDNIRFQNFYWTGHYNGAVRWVYNNSTGPSDNWYTNLEFVGWTHGAGNPTTPSAGTNDNMQCLGFGASGNDLVDSCFFDGLAGQDSGWCIRSIGNGTAMVNNVRALNGSNLLLPAGSCIVQYCDLGPMVPSFTHNFPDMNARVHENMLEWTFQGVYHIRNNVFHGSYAVTILNSGLAGSNPTTEFCYVYNNLFYDIGTGYCMGFDSCHAEVYNNTFYANSFRYLVRLNPNNTLPLEAIVRNNHVIDGAGVIWNPNNVAVTQSNNINQPATTAVSQGYTQSNLWQPANGSGDTVNQGVSTVNNLFTIDRLGVTRPQQAIWDLGCYEFGGTAPPATTATPVIAPATTGKFFLTSPVSVTMSDTSPSPSIFYTTNGATPTTGSTPYSGAFNVTTGATTVKAIATSAGLATSGVAQNDYEIGSVNATPSFKTANFTGQSGVFTWTFRAAPTVANADAVVGLGPNAVQGYTDMGPIIRFNPSGIIDVYNDTAYTNVSAVSYDGSHTYTFVVSIDMTATPTRKYSVTVTPSGGSTTTIATNYLFRNTQAAPTQLAYIGTVLDQGAMVVDNISFTPTTSDATAPTPNPMTFASAPAATSPTAITMTATTATDATSPPVEYFFTETTNNAGGANSGWQSSATYVNSGLSPSTLYTYQVKARDAVGNETTYSTAASATTQNSLPPGNMNCNTINVTTIRIGP